MSATVAVGCKLPNGIILAVGEKQVLIPGANSSPIAGGHGTAMVPKDFWDEFCMLNPDFQPIKAGVLFVSDTVRNVDSYFLKGDGASALTGLEGLDKDKAVPGVTSVAARKDD